MLKMLHNLHFVTYDVTYRLLFPCVSLSIKSEMTKNLENSQLMEVAAD